MTTTMSPFVLLFIINTVLLVASEDFNTDREERLRSALIDAFQTIKKGSGKDFNDEPLNSDLIGSVSGKENLTKEKPTTEDFALFEDDDGLTFAEAFGDNVQTEKQSATTVKSHNVQHIVKSTKPYEKSTNRPLENIINKLSDSIRSTVNETRSNLQLLKSENLNENETLLGMDKMLRVFDAEILVKQWKSLQKTVDEDCRAEMTDYVNGLTEKQLWAMKMDDASGRYTTMFYWGNNYWTGSSELCNALNDQRNIVQHENKTSGSQIFTAWREDVSLADEGPPFPTAFFMLRLKVTTNIPNIIKTHRTLHLGLCLPRVCTPEEIGALVDATRVSLLAHEVLAVRSAAHAAFTYMNDTTFLILLGVTTIVVILLLTATVYDMKLARDVRKQRQRVQNMTADTSSSNADLKLDLHGLDGKSVYNVNNNVAISKMSDEHLTAETSSTQEELKLSIWSELLLSFSMKANILQIFDQTVGSDTVPVVHGLRSLSMVWVIFGHTCIVVFKYADNTALRAMLEKSFLFQLIISAVYSVDTFFCLGGMLVSFLYFRTNAKGTLDVLTKGRRKATSGILQFLGLIGYRFARLTAPYLFMLGVVEVTMKWFHYNSVFEPPAADHENCPQYWWRNVLYINTLFPVEQMCMLWSWYLSDDTQFYAVSAVLLILATSHFKLSVSLTGLFFVSSLLTTGYVSWTSEHIPNSEDPFTQFDKIYDKPWTRLGPYLVGMVVGWILFKTNLRIRMKKIWAWLGWIVCSSTLLFLIFGLYKTQLGVASAAVYSALSHSLWAACIGWIIIACSTGYGGWVRPLLSSPILYPFSRVTYCAYLVHPVVLRYVAMHLTHPIHLGEMLVFVLFLGLTVISYVLAFLISVAFEAPMVTMLKILSPQRKPHRV